MTFVINESRIVYKDGKISGKQTIKRGNIQNLNKNDLYSLFLIPPSSKNISEHIIKLTKAKKQTKRKQHHGKKDHQSKKKIASKYSKEKQTKRKGHKNKKTKRSL